MGNLHGYDLHEGTGTSMCVSSGSALAGTPVVHVGPDRHRGHPANALGQLLRRVLPAAGPAEGEPRVLCNHVFMSIESTVSSDCEIGEEL